MRERPILFSAPMVRAILGGAKTQTRRVADMDKLIRADVRDYGPEWDEHVWSATANAHVRCPYGEPGDRLWVKETYALHHAWDAHPPSAGGAASKRVWHRADAPDAIDGRGRWRPSIHMPRWASRLTLEVTSVRVERLHAITEDDARAEGVEASNGAAPSGWARHNFADLWESINGPESWEANPFVWVVGFKRVEVRHG